MTTFLVIGVIGLAVLAVSLLLGDVLDGLFDSIDGVGGDWFSTEVVGAFVAALGFGGAAAESLGLPVPLSLAVGGAAGLGFAWVAAWFTRLVRGQGSEQPTTSADSVGYEAVVVGDIPASGYGTVEVRQGEHVTRYNAQAELALESGTRVHVTQALSPTAVQVAPLWDTGGI